MAVSKFTLVFPSLNRLWGFVRETKMNYLDMESSTIALVCECDDTVIHIAKEKYGATCALSTL
jgi:hypothetical protein